MWPLTRTTTTAARDDLPLHAPNAEEKAAIAAVVRQDLWAPEDDIVRQTRPLVPSRVATHRPGYGISLRRTIRAIRKREIAARWSVLQLGAALDAAPHRMKLDVALSVTGMTHAQLAAQSGVPYWKVRYLRYRAKKSPPAADAIAIAAVFGLGVEEFWGAKAARELSRKVWRGKGLRMVAK